MHSNLVIANPIAGRGAGERLCDEALHRLEGYGMRPDLAITSGPGHARELAREAVSQGRVAVVALGGDGTVNEVLNGLLEASDGHPGPALGVLPVGTGNDFAASADLPLDLEVACRGAAAGRSRVLDVGWVQADSEEPLYFGNGVGIGFDAVANIESRKIKWLKGYPLYLAAVLKTLAIYYNAPQTQIRIDDDQRAHPSIMISVMNGYRLGGGFQVTPGAKMDDGLLDVCIATKVRRLQMIGFVPRFMRGTHVTDHRVRMSQGRQVTVVSESPWAAHVDGEIYGVGALKYVIRLLPNRLRLIQSE
jgi:YegS/Rv2252/BmrU family lipid kinase